MMVMIKAECFVAASNLVAGVISNLPDDLSGTYDAKMEAQVALTWEVFRTFGHAMVKAMDSDEWPSPKEVTDDLRAGLPALIASFADNPAVAAILKSVLGKIGDGPQELS